MQNQSISPNFFFLSSSKHWVLYSNVLVTTWIKYSQEKWSISKSNHMKGPPTSLFCHIVIFNALQLLQNLIGQLLLHRLRQLQNPLLVFQELLSQFPHLFTSIKQKHFLSIKSLYKTDENLNLRAYRSNQLHGLSISSNPNRLLYPLKLIHYKFHKTTAAAIRLKDFQFIRNENASKPQN